MRRGTLMCARVERSNGDGDDSDASTSSKDCDGNDGESQHAGRRRHGRDHPSVSGRRTTKERDEDACAQPTAQEAQAPSAQEPELNDEDYRERLHKAKKLARSEITVGQWDRYRFSELDLDATLGPVEDNVERVSCHDLTLEEFRDRFEVPCKPCVITGLLDRWPASHRWTLDSLKDRFGSSRLKCGEDDEGYKVRLLCVCVCVCVCVSHTYIHTCIHTYIWGTR